MRVSKKRTGYELLKRRVRVSKKRGYDLLKKEGYELLKKGGRATKKGGYELVIERRVRVN